MDNNEVFKICHEAVQFAKQGEFKRADECLVKAAEAVGLLVIPLEAYGEAGRIAVASAGRAILTERQKAFPYLFRG